MEEKNGENRLRPKRDEAILINATSVESLDLKHLGLVWDYLRVESTGQGVILFVRKKEKIGKNISAIGHSHHPYCRKNEFLAFKPFQEGISKTFFFLFTAIKRRHPTKKDIEKWWEGLEEHGVRVVKNPEGSQQNNLLIFLDKKWKRLIDIH